MYNETQLAALKLFGDKALSDGCILKHKLSGYLAKVVTGDENCEYLHIEVHRGDISFLECREPKEIIENYEIIGHEPHWDDLFKFILIEKNWHFIIETDKCGLYDKDTPFHVLDSNGDDIGTIWHIDFSLPLLDQPNLSEIVNLFSK